jgi:4-hydroxy-tetrahydrodipicolinate reductase
MLRILHVGLGPLGRIVAGDLHERGLGAVIGAVDVAPELTGRALSELVPGAGDVRVVRSIAEAAPERADSAIVTTSSELPRCAPLLRELAEHGLPVVSTCEELVYPWLRHRALADELDALAKERGARLLGTGVNPGFLMDALPVFASAVCKRVRSVHAYRVQDAATRRIPFQKKIGVGLDEREFDARVRSGALRHVGLGESLHFIAERLGIEIERWSEDLAPVRAERRLESALGRIEVGGIAGVRQVATGTSRGHTVIRMEFQAAIGQRDPHDRIVVDGEPVLDVVLRGGVHGDTATSAIVLNSIRALRAAPPGLHTMATIPMVAWSAPRALAAAR